MRFLENESGPVTTSFLIQGKRSSMTVGTRQISPDDQSGLSDAVKTITVIKEGRDIGKPIGNDRSGGSKRNTDKTDTPQM